MGLINTRSDKVRLLAATPSDAAVKLLPARGYGPGGASIQKTKLCPSNLPLTASVSKWIVPLPLAEPESRLPVSWPGKQTLKAHPSAGRQRDPG